MKISYTAGSYYKKFYGSTMSQMNRAAVASAASAMTSYSSSVFDTNVSLSQGISQLATEQYAARITAEAKEKLASASDISSILASLGATTAS